MKAIGILLALALAGCTSTTTIGPYVKSVARNGAWLAVQKCMIVMEGDELSEGECTVDHVPLATVPAAPVAPAVAPPLRPGTAWPAPQPIPH